MAQKILLLDIETAPHKVYTWGLWKQDIALNQIEEAGYTLCWSAKWVGERKVMFSSIHKNGKRRMLHSIYKLINKADTVIHYNGSKFDIPILNQEFLAMEYGPPSPVIQIDLLNVVKKRFRFPSNKLNYVAEYLGLGKKRPHKGMALWRDCMQGKQQAWREMEKYNKRDIAILEAVYKALLPWVPSHSNAALFEEGEVPVCPNCGSAHLQRRGFYYTKTQKYRRFQCQDCGAWSRGRYTTIDTPEKKKVILVGVS